MQHLYFATGVSLWLVGIMFAIVFLVPMWIGLVIWWMGNFLHDAAMATCFEGLDLMRAGVGDDHPPDRLG